MPELRVIGQGDVAEQVVNNRARRVAEVGALAVGSRILRGIELVVRSVAVVPSMLFALSW